MRKLLWIGDAVVDTGFARSTHKILDIVQKTWDVSVLGLNYRGDPHNYPYPVYPTFVRDGFGLSRLPEVVDKVHPELIVVQNDPWNLPSYMKPLSSFPIAAVLPVDGLNCRGRDLNGLRLAIFWTKFGLDEARRGGYTGPAAIIPLGVDLDIYSPCDRKEARDIAGLPPKYQDDFIVGNVNRNQPRKRLDLTIKYFAQWVKEFKIPNARLFLHVAPTGESGVDCEQLASYYGIQNRLILSDPGIYKGVEERKLALLYSCFDVQVSTTQGEGWGLTTMEGMACGIPQIVPAWSALEDWAKAAVRIPCSTTATTFDGINVIGGIPDEQDFIYALNEMYHGDSWRREVISDGLKLVQNPEYNWKNIGERFATGLEEAMMLPFIQKKQFEVKEELCQ